ncbi:hypothetical protein BLNAU_6670 [Blattamonas nauphoetae]|uniref:Uncharacterized protein n=1 Tax=Blattamonas nauphoetae TaxID=2049346 RepID=A0ABQ9Y3X2_9EUKA|nr:hypothetical protein BLNAU_6670 [Blattamonas nauphoetae]
MEEFCLRFSDITRRPKDSSHQPHPHTHSSLIQLQPRHQLVLSHLSSNFFYTSNLEKSASHHLTHSDLHSTHNSTTSMLTSPHVITIFFAHLIFVSRHSQPLSSFSHPSRGTGKESSSLSCIDSGCVFVPG